MDEKHMKCYHKSYCRIENEFFILYMPYLCNYIQSLEKVPIVSIFEQDIY